jgi:hypothetical protein
MSEPVRASPSLLAFVAVSFALVAGVAGFSTWRVLHPVNATNVVPPPSPSHGNGLSSKQVPPPVEPAAGSGEGWFAGTTALSCPAPCLAGSACSQPLDAGLAKCISGLTCIPGSPGATFDGTERVSLRLSAIREADTDVDSCKSGSDLWLCARPSSSTTWQCSSQREACRSATSLAAFSTVSIPLTGEALLREGVDFIVRQDGPEGEVLAQLNGHTFERGLKREAACKGQKIRFDEPRIEWASFFLVPD